MAETPVPAGGTERRGTGAQSYSKIKWDLIRFDSIRSRPVCYIKISMASASEAAEAADALTDLVDSHGDRAGGRGQGPRRSVTVDDAAAEPVRYGTTLERQLCVLPHRPVPV